MLFLSIGRRSMNIFVRYGAAVAIEPAGLATAQAG
jgi:hypothetical protein